MCILLCIKNSLNEKVTVGNEYITHNKQDVKYYQIINDENESVTLPAEDFVCLYHMDEKDIENIEDTFCDQMVMCASLRKKDVTLKSIALAEISQCEIPDVNELFRFNIEPEYSQEFIHEKLIPAIYENNKGINSFISEAFGINNDILDTK